MALVDVVALVAVVGVFLYCLRKYFLGGVCNSTAKLDGKTVIITGANTGIGKETAVDLAERGARVIIACRNVHKGTAALKEIQQRSGSQHVYLEQLDLASLDSIRDFAARIKKSEAKLHILINNAGVCMGNKFTRTEDGFETTFGVNHLGHFLLTNLLLDLLKKSAPSRIVNVSSSGYSREKEIKFEDINDEKSYKPFKAYVLSKLANVLFTRELAKRLEGPGVTTYALHPGVIYTEIGREFNYPLLLKILTIIFWIVLKTPKQGAQTTIYCAVAEELEGESGRYYSDCAEKQVTDYAKDDQAARKLWDVSAEYVGL